MKTKFRFKAVTQKATSLINKGQQVEIWHTQSIKQNQNYQSSEASYGCKLTCADNPLAIAATIQRAEALVEPALIEKVKQHNSLLSKMSS